VRCLKKLTRKTALHPPRGSLSIPGVLPIVIQIQRFSINGPTAVNLTSIKSFVPPLPLVEASAAVNSMKKRKDGLCGRVFLCQIVNMKGKIFPTLVVIKPDNHTNKTTGSWCRICKMFIEHYHVVLSKASQSACCIAGLPREWDPVYNVPPARPRGQIPRQISLTNYW